MTKLTEENCKKWNEIEFEKFSERWAKIGIFLNDETFEVEIANTPNLGNVLLEILEERGFGKTRSDRIQKWKKNPTVIDSVQLLSMVKDIGKGRLSGKLKKKISDDHSITPPTYISNAINYIVKKCQVI